MSLLDGPEQVTVRPEVEDTDADGNPIRRPGTTTVTLSCRVQPIAADEPAVAGQAIATVYRVIAKTWPPGATSTVTWQGRTWDVLGEPLRHGGSPAVQHVTILIRARAPEVL